MKTPIFPAPPQPPGGGGGSFPAPRGIDNLHDLIGEDSPIEQGKVIDTPTASTGGFAVDDERVICGKCKHCWQIETFAAVKNLRPDGTPFTHRESYCLTLAPTAIVTLEQRFVHHCNRFEASFEESCRDGD